jgi:hypothetical protein
VAGDGRNPGYRRVAAATPAHRDGALGAQLARLEARVLFEELVARFDGIELDGQVTRMKATMVPGVKQMPVRLSAAALSL